MSVLEVAGPQQPTAERGAQRIRRTLAQTFHQIETSLAQVRQVCERHGRKDIKDALGDDDKEVVQLYKALKEFVEKHKPKASIDDLPT